MNIRSKVGLCVVVVAAAVPALGQDEQIRVRSQGWGVISHQTVGQGNTVLGLQLGFPGLNLGLLHGLQKNLDVGGRLSVNYAYEGMVRQIHPGLKVDLLGRLKLLEGQRLGLGLNFGLGYTVTFAPAGRTVQGISLPLGFVAGFAIGSALTASFSVDMPLFVTFGTDGGLTVPILGGVGLEYFIDKSLLLNFGTKMGPALNPTGLFINRSAEFAFQVYLGVALKL
ncbi:MAG: hypothetical protein M3Y59_06450 [Myxococcota bacterium]|nr:hypothetical protein [Myxococcota bacterium]